MKKKLSYLFICVIPLALQVFLVLHLPVRHMDMEKKLRFALHKVQKKGKIHTACRKKNHAHQFSYFLQYITLCRWMLDPRSSKREDIVSKIQKTYIKPKEESHKPVVDPYLEPFSEIDGKKVCNFCAKK